jgi:hypothetical protein
MYEQNSSTEAGTNASPESLPEQLGATASEWRHFAKLFDPENLVPAVANRDAPISQHSTLDPEQLGKVPSRYTPQREVVGFAKWQEHRATTAQVARWSREPDYSICLITGRGLVAIDVDVSDPAIAGAVDEVLCMFDALDGPLPRRGRAGSSKFLALVRCRERLAKRRMTLPSGGAVELLALGQQALVAGTHPSGARYAWRGGLPEHVPELSADSIVRLLEAIRETTGATWGTPTTVDTAAPSDDATPKPTQGASDDDICAALERLPPEAVDDYDQWLRVGMGLHHETDGDERGLALWHEWSARGATYDEAMLDRKWYTFKRSDSGRALTLAGLVGSVGDPAADFEVLPVDAADQERAARFTPIPAAEFVERRGVMRWLVQDVLPVAPLAMLYGESGSGKSFAALDIAMSIARGVAWRGHAVERGRVVYVAAEGAGGFAMRLRAYARHHEVALDGLDVVADGPNLLERTDVKALCQSIGPAALVVIDTLAASAPGANENASEDMGRALKAAGDIHRATGALVLLVHHAGKDASRGARGWSGLRAAVDAELEVSRDGDARTLKITKQKDGADGAVHTFTLRSVVIEHAPDADGELPTSCVVEWGDPAAVKVRPGREPRTDRQRLAYQVVLDLIGFDGSCTVESAIAAVATKLVPSEKSKKDKRRQHARDALQTLADNRFLSLDGDVFRLPGGSTDAE